MSKNAQRDQIHDAAEKFADVIAQVTSKDTRVGIFYCYLDKECEEWVSGDAGNMNWIERVGAINYLKKCEESVN